MRNPAADRLRSLLPLIMQQWERRVRAEVPAARDQDQTILHNSLAQMLEVMAKVLADQTDPRTAVRDAGFMIKHGGERAALAVYSLEQMILECQILQEVVIDLLEQEELLNQRDRSIVLSYLGEVIRVAAGEYVRVQDEVRDEYARKLEKANRSLEQADQAKDEFLAMLGHELRNPLGAISNSIYVLRQVPGGGGVSERAFGVAERQLRNMTELVNQLLDVARISEGLITLHKQPLEIEDAVAQSVDAIFHVMEARGHALSLSRSGGRLYAHADPVRFGQVLENLLSNAAKYTPPGGRIEVTVEKEDDEAAVRVRDNGIGMEAGLVPHVFDLFRQADRAADRAEGGLGIGLTVARRLIEMHGGTVEAHSGGPGQGSEFVVRLPLLPEAPQEPWEDRPAHGVASGLRILLVEDNADAADLLREILEMWEHSVVAVRTGPAALEAVKAQRPHVVLMDIGLPGMDGYEVARLLRADEAGLGARLVALTGYHEDEKLKSAGFDGFMSKPVDLERLERLLADIVRDIAS